MKPTRPTKPTCPSIPCYSPDGTSLGHRTLAAAQRLVADGYVRPAYGRKGHLRAIWLLSDDGSNPVQSHARQGTRYSFIETLDNGRCWQLRRLDRIDRLDRRDPTTPDGMLANPRAPFLQVIRECMAAPSPGAMATDALPNAKPAMLPPGTSIAARTMPEGKPSTVTPATVTGPLPPPAACRNVAVPGNSL
jgi:hypothetical protein